MNRSKFDFLPSNSVRWLTAAALAALVMHEALSVRGQPPQGTSTSMQTPTPTNVLVPKTCVASASTGAFVYIRVDATLEDHTVTLSPAWAGQKPIVSHISGGFYRAATAVGDCFTVPRPAAGARLRLLASMFGYSGSRVDVSEPQWSQNTSPASPYVLMLEKDPTSGRFVLTDASSPLTFGHVVPPNALDPEAREAYYSQVYAFVSHFDRADAQLAQMRMLLDTPGFEATELRAADSGRSSTWVLATEALARDLGTPTVRQGRLELRTPDGRTLGRPQMIRELRAPALE